MVTDVGVVPPDVKGDPAIGVNDPLVESIAKAETSFDVWLATYANRPASVQLTTTLVTSALSMVPEPLWTVQICVGLEGCVATVTE